MSVQVLGLLGTFRIFSGYIISFKSLSIGPRFPDVGPPLGSNVLDYKPGPSWKTDKSLVAHFPSPPLGGAAPRMASFHYEYERYAALGGQSPSQFGGDSSNLLYKLCLNQRDVAPLNKNNPRWTLHQLADHATSFKVCKARADFSTQIALAI